MSSAKAEEEGDTSPMSSILWWEKELKDSN